jgi:hypothetical protein
MTDYEEERVRKILWIIGFMLWAAVFGMMLDGCRAYVQHPGAASRFDSQAYDALLVAHDAIETAKTDLKKGSLPANSGEYLNILIKSYNTADALYKTYHDAALKGLDTSQAMANLQIDLNQLAQDLASFKKASGKP